ncbi:hypothetical protein [Streptomyces malaysiensis]|uniref:hypothetical protein n=1 Tax=Streptomyces malaysiensis TaxID=92644 RepID=UPI000AEB4D68|nr:hypothetical protein [Streptomyces sp. SPMA113]
MKTRVLVAARNQWERVFCTRAVERLGEVGAARLLVLVAEGNEDGAALLALSKRDPGAGGLDSLLTEVRRAQTRAPEGLFADCSEKLVAAWRARAIKMYPSDFRDAAEDVRITLLMDALALLEKYAGARRQDPLLQRLGRGANGRRRTQGLARGRLDHLVVLLGWHHHPRLKLRKPGLTQEISVPQFIVLKPPLQLAFG